MLQCLQYFFQEKYLQFYATFGDSLLSNFCMNDKDLVTQILSGNMNAFTFLVNQHQRLVVHITGRLIQRQDELEDVCQEVFLKVFQNMGKYRFECKLSTWIATIAYNTSINYLRKFKKGDMISSDELPLLTNASVAETVDFERTDLHQYLRDQIELLPVQYRTVLTLFHLEEFSYQEIEQITGMPEGTIKSYLFRAKALLKEKLKFVVDDDSLLNVKEISHGK